MVTCNFAPAEMRRIGSGFDLPIAACGQAAMKDALGRLKRGLWMWVGEP